MRKVVFKISANEGYSPAQVRGRLTVGELREFLEDLPDDDMEIITDDESNRYGARWGIMEGFDIVNADEDDDEE